jgi:cell division protein FtsL
MTPPSRATAASRAPARAPRPEVPAPRRLRVVEEHRAVVTTASIVLGVVLTVVVVFGIVAFHTLLVGNQSQLDDLDRRIAAERAELDRLVLREAQLSAPERIVRVASDDLGMVTPAEVVWLEPVDAHAAADEAPETAASATSSTEAPSDTP